MQKLSFEDAVSRAEFALKKYNNCYEIYHRTFYPNSRSKNYIEQARIEFEHSKAELETWLPFLIRNGLCVLSNELYDCGTVPLPPSDTIKTTPEINNNLLKQAEEYLNEEERYLRQLKTKAKEYPETYNTRYAELCCQIDAASRFIKTVLGYEVTFDGTSYQVKVKNADNAG